MRPRPAALAPLLLLFMALCPGRAPGAEIDFAPLLHYRPTASGYELTAAGPLFQRTEEFTAVRPFYCRNEKATDILYPLGRFTENSSTFVPLMRSVDEDDRSSLDVLLFSKGRSGDETYGGLFPFYGTYLNRFGHDSVRYVLWPAYTKTEDDGVERTIVMWPFLKYSEGRELQLWPLYGHVRRESSDDRYLLWPFLFRKRGVEDYDAFLPFFSYSRGRASTGVSVLWPFFTCNRSTSPQHLSLTFPWPLVRYATGAYEERQFFPLYWSKVEGDTYRMKTVLWPVYRHAESSDPGRDVRSESTCILILSGTSRETRGQTVQSDSATLWPLWHRHDDPGGSSWYFPWIIPLHSEGYRRNILPLLTLAQGTARGGTSELSFLWHTFLYTKEGGRSRFSLSFLFSHERGQGYQKTGFLSDLVGWTWSAAPGEEPPPPSPE